LQSHHKAGVATFAGFFLAKTFATQAIARRASLQNRFANCNATRRNPQTRTPQTHAPETLAAQGVART